jgi:hypothetical protein
MAKTTANPSLHWSQSSPGDPGIGGGITAIFGSSGCEPPAALRGLFKGGWSESSLRAAMFAREAIANSWDAYWSSGPDGQHDFEIHFRFRTLDPVQTRQVVRTLGIDELSERLAELGGSKAKARKSLGLGSTDFLDDISRPLRVLEVEERWGGGMGGSWDANDSAMDRALVKVGWAQAKEGAGGSFGYGKAAVAQGSRFNSVLAYSCFEKSPGDSVTRRLLGVTYWKPHSVATSLRVDYNGFVVFGDHRDGKTRAFEDKAADDLAAALGLTVRAPGKAGDQGTTLLIVDPAFDREELIAAVLSNWWPALQHTMNYRLHVFTSSDDDEPEEIKVDESHELLGPFVRSYLEAEKLLPDFLDTNSKSTVADETVNSAEVISSEVRRGEEIVGGLGLTEIPSDQAVGVKSLVATMRLHRMVITYLDVGSGSPFVRGAFIADGNVNNSLRLTEPAEHDKWLRTASTDHRGSRDDIALAKLVKSEIDKAAVEFRRNRTVDKPSERNWTPGFSSFLGVPGGAKGVGPKKKPKPKKKVKPRDVHIHLVHPDDYSEVERPTRRPGQSPGTLQALATVEFSLTPNSKLSRNEVEFIVRARVVEESGTGSSLPLVVSAPTQFRCHEDGSKGTARFRAELVKGTPQRLTIVTSEYSDEWTVDLVFDALVLDADAKGENNGK